MRRYSMKEAIRDTERGQKVGSAAFEAEVERDSQLAEELHTRINRDVILPFLSEHPDINAEVTGPALLRIAALHIMADLGMEPDDFVELARVVATEAEPEAKAVRARASKRGQS